MEADFSKQLCKNESWAEAEAIKGCDDITSLLVTVELIENIYYSHYQMEFTKFLSERFEPYKLEIRGKFKERYLITYGLF